MDFHHPLFQSLALPLAVAFMAAGVLRGALGAVHGRRWAAAGVGIAILIGASWVLGWRVPPGSLTEKLPWIYAAAALLGTGLEAMRAGKRTQWLACGLLWAFGLVVLGEQTFPFKIISWLVGMAVIGAVLHEPVDRAHAPAVLAVASLGLAVAAMTASSALLFELSLALAAAVAGCALWLWPVVRIGFGAVGVVAPLMAWLALAQGTGLLTSIRPAVLLLLAAAFSAGALVRWRRRTLETSRPWVETLAVAAVAAVWVAAALALAFWGEARAPAGGLDDPYYQPRW